MRIKSEMVKKPSEYNPISHITCYKLYNIYTTILYFIALSDWKLVYAIPNIYTYIWYMRTRSNFLLTSPSGVFKSTSNTDFHFVLPFYFI